MTVCESARRVLDEAALGLEIGQERTIDGSGGRFMALVVARLSDVGCWHVYTAGHYVMRRDRPRTPEQPAPDPSVTFLRSPHGAWLPAGLESPLVHLRGIAIETDRIRVVDRVALRSVVLFCNVWLHNVRHQQRLGGQEPSAHAQVPSRATYLRSWTRNGWRR